MFKGWPGSQCDEHGACQRWGYGRFWFYTSFLTTKSFGSCSESTEDVKASDWRSDIITVSGIIQGDRRNGKNVQSSYSNAGSDHTYRKQQW